MNQFDVKGMSCAACVNRVEKAVQTIDGVESCTVSLLTNSMSVEGNANKKDIIKAVEKAGYKANLKGTKIDSIEDDTMKPLIYRLVISILFLLVLMYISMGHTMFGFVLPSFLEDNALALGMLECILAGIVMVINQRFFISGFKAILHKSPNMDTLVALGSMVSFVYSIVILFVMTEKIDLAHSYLHELYFESAAMILVFISIGKLLETRSKGKTTSALKALMDLSPKMATILKENKEEVVPIDQVKVGDIFVVKPGESIPVDGVVLEGSSSVNEASLTGESIPVDKFINDEVSAATINQYGYLKCKAIRVGKDTALSKIIEMVSDAAATKAPIAKIADQVAGIFVPSVLLISFITCIVWLLVGKPIGEALMYATSVLVISCPCSLGLATPVAIMVGSGVGAKNGILYKNASALESAGRIQIVALDKTGTITQGQPQITDMIPYEKVEEELLQLAYTLENKSEHPFAKAIVKRAKELNILLMDTVDTKAVVGKGIQAMRDGNILYGGNASFVFQYASIPADLKEKAVQLSNEGKTPLYFGVNDTIWGLIAIADVMKEDAKEAISELENMGIEVVMITGDNDRTANTIANHVGISHVVANVLPKDKEDVVKKLMEYGKVCMVGDGINDAPALTRANLGVAIGTGTDVAIDAADIVLMQSQLKSVPAMVRLGRATLKNIHENLFWAFFYNAIGIPVAAGVFVSTLGIRLNPMIGALAMSLSSVCVVSNALRLNRVSIFDTKKDKNKQSVHIPDEILHRKEIKMTKTMKIEGMMCPRCQAHVKEALESIEGVTNAEVSHESGMAIVTCDETVTNEVLKETVEKEKYTVLNIE